MKDPSCVKFEVPNSKFETSYKFKISKRKYLGFCAWCFGFYELSSHERQEPHHPRTLNSLCKHPLVLSAHAGMLRVNNFCLTRRKTLQKLNFLVVNRFCVL